MTRSMKKKKAQYFFPFKRIIGNIRKNRMKKRIPDSQSSYSSSNSCSSNFSIPECIWMEILCWLPAKSVVRCKCVSKQWLSLISDPYLVRHYQSLHPNTCTFIHNQYEEKLGFEYSIADVITRTNPKSVDNSKSPIFSKIAVVPFSKLKHSTLELAASSNGLLLCKEYMSMAEWPWEALQFWIFNPVTLQFVKLPRAKLNTRKRFGGEGFVTLVDAAGVVVSYKVVRPLLGCLGSNVHNFQVFSSEKGAWEEFDVYFFQPVQISFWHKPVVYNGILHWLSHSDENSNLVIAYDPYTRAEWCRVFAFPRGNKMNMCFGLVRGHLGCVLMDNPSLDLCNISDWSWKLWTLKDYDKGEWSLEYNFSSTSLDNVFVDAYLSSTKRTTISGPKFFHPLDSDIIYFWGNFGHSRHYVSYNIRNQYLEVVKGSCRIGERDGWFYALPFVIPSWPTVIPQPSWNRKS